MKFLELLKFLIWGASLAHASEWECPACTLMNENYNLKCEICETDKPETITDENWSCLVCTFINAAIMEKCEACFTLKGQFFDQVQSDNLTQHPRRLNIQTDDSTQIIQKNGKELLGKLPKNIIQVLSTFLNGKEHSILVQTNRGLNAMFTTLTINLPKMISYRGKNYPLEITGNHGPWSEDVDKKYKNKIINETRENGSIASKLKFGDTSHNRNPVEYSNGTIITLTFKDNKLIEAESYWWDDDGREFEEEKTKLDTNDIQIKDTEKVNQLAFKL